MSNKVLFSTNVGTFAIIENFLQVRMISLKSSLKICTKIHGNSVFHLFGATLPFRQVSDKRLIRKPLKKFKPTTSMKHLEELEEDDFYESQLKQARRIADVSHELIVPKSRRKEPVKLATSEKKIGKGR